MNAKTWPKARRTGRALTALIACGCACAPAARPQDIAAVQERPNEDRLITSSSMGRIRLGMTLDEARRTFGSTAVLSRTEDGDCAAFVAVMEGQEHTMTLWANEEDPARPIDWSRPIEYIDTFNDAFHTEAGVRPGALVEDVMRLLGPVTEIVESEIESRQFITFERQPPALTFRLDYTGIFTGGSRRTTRFSAGAKILSIAISSHDQP
jgi:hypothetical protein